MAEIRHNFTEEQRERIIGLYCCMRDAYREVIYDYLEKGKAIVEKDRFGRLTVTILPEKG